MHIMARKGKQSSYSQALYHIIVEGEYQQAAVFTILTKKT